MMNGEQVLSIYESVSAITGQMLLAARRQDWGQLESLGSQYSQQIGSLKSDGPMAPVQGDQREHKVRLLRKILQDDRLIRDATQPGLKDLQALIHGTTKQRKLARHYPADDSA